MALAPACTTSVKLSFGSVHSHPNALDLRVQVDYVAAHLTAPAARLNAAPFLLSLDRCQERH
jgi:hypothetical protein